MIKIRTTYFTLFIMTQVQLLRLLIARTHEQTFVLKPAISQLLRNFLYDKEKTLLILFKERHEKRGLLGATTTIYRFVLTFYFRTPGQFINEVKDLCFLSFQSMFWFSFSLAINWRTTYKNNHIFTPCKTF